MNSPNSKNNYHLSGILVGDELGLLKRIDLTTAGSKISNVNDDQSDPSPSTSIVSIRPFDYEVNNVLYLVAKKPSTISLYNCLTNQFIDLQSPPANNEFSIIGAQPIARSNIVICYDNGTIQMQNIEKELLESSEMKKKALKLLGLDLAHSSDSSPKTYRKSYPSSSSSSSKSTADKNKTKTDTLPKATTTCLGIKKKRPPSQIANTLEQSGNERNLLLHELN